VDLSDRGSSEGDRVEVCERGAPRRSEGGHHHTLEPQNNIRPRVNCKTECGPHLHLPVGHVMRAVLHATKDAIELGRKRVCICEFTVSGEVLCEIMSVWTLDAEELSNFQCCATHPRELRYEARQICLRHHKRGSGLAGVAG
jgi:hypothetical protein